MRVTPRREHARVTFEVVGLVGLKNHPVEPSGAGKALLKALRKTEPIEAVRPISCDPKGMGKPTPNRVLGLY